MLKLPDLPDFTSLREQLALTFKPSNIAPKAMWLDWPLHRFPEYTRTIPPESISSGEIGIWLQASAYHHQTRYMIPWLDIESYIDHDNINLNIEAGQKLYLLLEALGLTDELIVGLSGRGLRFIWPYLVPLELSEAFKAFAKDEERFPGIDHCLQRNGQFSRVMAYRNNTKQGSPKDIHVDYLEKTEDLLGLTEDRYRELTSGKPDVARYMETLPRLLPQAWMSRNWLEFLASYERIRALRSNIIQFKPPQLRMNRGVNWEAIDIELRAQGIRIIRSFSHQGTQIHKLSACPACGESEGNPYVTEAGWLRCHRSNHCPAGQDYPFQDKLIKGLPPSQWIPEYQGSNDLACNDGDSFVSDMTVAQARVEILEALRLDMDVCIKASPGVGKTTTTLQEVMPKCADGHVLFTLPTSFLAREVFEKANRMASEAKLGVQIHFIEGRNEANCHKSKIVNSAAQKGYYPALVVCSNCPHRKGCVYLEQFKKLGKAGLIVTTHAMALHLQGKIEPTLHVIDESPVQTYMSTQKSSMDDMLYIRSMAPDYVEEFFVALESASKEMLRHINPGEQGRLYCSQSPFGYWENTKSLWDFMPVSRDDRLNYATMLSCFLRGDDENVMQWQWRLYKDEYSLKACEWIEACLIDAQESGTAYIKVEKDPECPIEFVHHVWKAPKYNCRTVLLDGTADLDETKALFGKTMKCVDAQVTLKSTKKVWLKASRGKTKMINRRHQDIGKDMTECLSYLGENDHRVLILTHQNVEARVLAAAKRLAPGKTFQSVHFWGSRGINAYEDYDAVIAFGTPTVNTAGLIDNAMALFEEQEDMDRWMAGLGPRDLVQGLHRIRPVYGSKTIIVLGSYWPGAYLGEPDTLVNLMRDGSAYEEAYQRLKRFALETGFVTKNLACMLGVACRDDQAVVEHWQQVLWRRDRGVGVEFVPTLIKDILIRVGTNSEGGYPTAIYLPGNTAWKQLIDRLREETGLPLLAARDDRSGRPTLGVGSLYAVRLLHARAQIKYTPELWEGQAYRRYTPAKRIPMRLSAYRGRSRISAAAILSREILATQSSATAHTVNPTDVSAEQYGLAA